MIERTVTTTIDPDRCVGCGECVRICPSQTLTLRAGKAVVTGDHSLGCGHCAAVCPVDAVRVEANDPQSLRFQTFDCRSDWMPYSALGPGELVRLMGSRRSCRSFEPKRVDRALLEDLVRIGTLAPSGTNSQRWTFTVLPDREAVMKLGNAVGAFFKRLNRMAAAASRPAAPRPTRAIGVLPGLPSPRSRRPVRLGRARARPALPRRNRRDPGRLAAGCKLPGRGRTAGDAEHPPRRTQPGTRDLPDRLCRQRHAEGRRDKGRAGHPARRSRVLRDRHGVPGRDLPAAGGKKKAAGQVRRIAEQDRKLTRTFSAPRRRQSQSAGP